MNIVSLWKVGLKQQVTATGDSNVAVTMLSPVAVTTLFAYNHNVKLQSVTDDSIMIKINCWEELEHKHGNCDNAVVAYSMSIFDFSAGCIQRAIPCGAQRIF